MGKKSLVIIFSLLILITLNTCMAQEINNTTDSIQNTSYKLDYTLSKSNNDLISTHIDVVSNNTFDVKGDYFKVKLSDKNNNSIKNAQIVFSINGANHKCITNNWGIASFQLKVNDGSYKIISKFNGDSKYKSCLKTTTIYMKNTLIVEKGLNNSEIQHIIDKAKANNVILFKGDSYENVHLLINKRLTLISNSNTVFKSTLPNPVILISGKSSSSTTIKGFKIQSSGNAIEIKNSDYVTIINNEITSKSNAIVANNVNYLNITKNTIVKNSKSAIVIALANHTYITNNKISNNEGSGIVLAKSKYTYIFHNTISNNKHHGIYTLSKIGNVNYGEGPQNLNIAHNTIKNNAKDGIYIYSAGNNIGVYANTITSNGENGIKISRIGSNTMQSNVISDNNQAGIKFSDGYVMPKNQKISYNVILNNRFREVEAKETYYEENGERLNLGDNWYSDVGTICPKIKSNNLRFIVKQVGSNQFQAAFYDSNGNIASKLPDRTLKYQINNGQSITIKISGGTATFTVDANDKDTIKAEVDLSKRSNVYDSKTPNKDTSKMNGKTPSYTYPSIKSPDYGGDGGQGNGNGGTSQGNNNANGTSAQTGDYKHNTTKNKNSNPSSTSLKPLNNDLESQKLSDSMSASGDGFNNHENSKQSVVKQIVLDEENIVKLSGISFIILLFLLTIALYYRRDIKEMNSKK